MFGKLLKNQEENIASKAKKDFGFCFEGVRGDKLFLHVTVKKLSKEDDIFSEISNELEQCK